MDAIRFGRGIRALRHRRRWRQVDLAAAARVSRSVVARIEQGLGDRLSVRTLARIAAAMDARVVVRLQWRAEDLDRLIDARHASLVEFVLAELTRLGWLCIPEATFSIYGERGSVDILAYHPATRVLLIVEVKSSIPEIGSLLIPLDRKARLGHRLAADRGWSPVAVGRLLVVADGRTTRRRIEQHAATLDAAFPVRGWDLRRWLASPEPLDGWSGLWLPALEREETGATV